MTFENIKNINDANIKVSEMASLRLYFKVIHKFCSEIST